MIMLRSARLLTAFTIFLCSAINLSVRAESLNHYQWTEVNSGAGVTWEPRAGLQAINHQGGFYVLGGRMPKMVPLTFADSIFFNDTWKSIDYGKSWNLVSSATKIPWAARAYFQAVSNNGYMYVLGGQDSEAVPNPDCETSMVPNVPCLPFILASNFFNDVWRSVDGEYWEQMTDDAKWSPRAGLSSVVHRDWIYVMGGSINDDSVITGPGGPPRIYYNDVYRSRDGKHWEAVISNAPWAPRAGAAVISKGQFIYLLGGEGGFACNDATPRCPPYFNDVWRSPDGLSWQLVTEAAGWSPRPGHQCEKLLDEMICFGGFGLSEDPTDPFKPSNPTDIWVSSDGEKWRELKGTASPIWNARSPAHSNYDFAAFPVNVINGMFQPSIFTFGGDRETFNPFDVLAFEKVDNHVWRFGPVEN
ncbi:MAG: hypothetical protein K0U59_08465 [Gammaproteobacteria bacterium]|nr:hypothetical protein [Gammaproteobacteria bacterium]